MNVLVTEKEVLSHRKTEIDKYKITLQYRESKCY